MVETIDLLRIEEKVEIPVREVPALLVEDIDEYEEAVDKNPVIVDNEEIKACAEN